MAGLHICNVQTAMLCIGCGVYICCFIFSEDEGVEIRVRLGSTWKNSLGELSGGQRSLVALALILAMLQFSPAPMYVLDEIDAALDLSHTQHIGALLREKFGGSQFIIVSLKEGLFTNANVLFKISFSGGTSTIERLQHNDRTGDGRDDREKENKKHLKNQSAPAIKKP